MLLIQAVLKAQTRGVYTLDEAYILKLAIDLLTKTKQENEKEQ